MTQPKDHGCPECGAPRGSDRTPSCACTERASEALRDAREAQAAAAEDFDPLRIRPYVELESTAGAEGTGGSGSSDSTAEAEPDATMPLHVRLPAPPPSPREPSATDIRLFEAPEAAASEPPREERPRGRRRRVLLLGSAAAVVAVVAAAGMASGLFSYEAPTRDTARPEAVRASVPDATESEQPSGSPEESPSATQSSSPSTTPTESASPSPSASTTSASPTPTPTPTQTPTPAQASDTPTPESTPAPEGGPVLRRGDKGPEVVELQLRLHQLWLYNDDINGNFNHQLEQALKTYQWSRGVGTEALGVYTAETRASLESETTEP